MRSCLARLDSTRQGLVVDHWPRQSTAAHFVYGFACVPTDDGAAPKTVDPVVPSNAAKSLEAIFCQQLQNQICISPIMFLLPWLGCSNLCRMTD